MDEDDKKLRREIHAAIAMHAMLVRLDKVVIDLDGDEPEHQRSERRRLLKACAKVSVEVADAMIAELGDLP